MPAIGAARAAIVRRHDEKNRMYPCSHSGCYTPRTKRGRFCQLHHRRIRYSGHPDGFAVHLKDIKSEITEARRFLRRWPEHPAVKAALDICGKWLVSFSLTRGEPGPNASFVNRELQRLADQGVTATELLSALIAVRLYAERRPHKLPDDIRLTYAWAGVVFRLRPGTALDERWSGGVKRIRYRRTGAIPRRIFGEAVRATLGVFLANAARHIEAEVEAKTRRITETRAALATPFITTTTNDKEPK
jgi:hypothetical protein